MQVNKNKILLKNVKGSPFVVKTKNGYYLEDDWNIYKGEEEFLLNAIKKVQQCSYDDLNKRTKEAMNMEEYWQVYFDYQYSGGGLVLWNDPSDCWYDELTRRGLLDCHVCGTKMYMNFRRKCPLCDPLKKDKYADAYNLTDICRKIENEKGLPPETIEKCLFGRSISLFNTSYKDADDGCLLVVLEFMDQNMVNRLIEVGVDREEIETINEYIRLIDELIPINQNKFWESH